MHFAVYLPVCLFWNSVQWVRSFLVTLVKVEKKVGYCTSVFVNPITSVFCNLLLVCVINAVDIIETNHLRSKVWIRGPYMIGFSIAANHVNVINLYTFSSPLFPIHLHPLMHPNLPTHHIPPHPATHISIYTQKILKHIPRLTNPRPHSQFRKT